MLKIMNVPVVLALLVATVSFGQEGSPFKIKFTGKDKKVSILVYQNAIKVTGYDGDEVIIEAERTNSEGFPKEAEGLKMVSGNNGIADNTGFGVGVQETGNVLKITVPKNKYYGNVSIKIPREVAVSISENENIWNNKWNISGLSGEIELKANHTAINLDDISGPLVCYAGWGKVKINYGSVSQKAPHSITSYSPVDVTLPADSKATLYLKSAFGDVFTDWEITPTKETKKQPDALAEVKDPKNDKTGQVVINEVLETNNVDAATNTKTSTLTKKYAIVMPPSPQIFISKNGDNKSWDFANINDHPDPNAVDGSINGGGVKVFINASNGNIYLRKKKAGGK